MCWVLFVLSPVAARLLPGRLLWVGSRGPGARWASVGVARGLSCSHGIFLDRGSSSCLLRWPGCSSTGLQEASLAGLAQETLETGAPVLPSRGRFKRGCSRRGQHQVAESPYSGRTVPQPLGWWARSPQTLQRDGGSFHPRPQADLPHAGAPKVRRPSDNSRGLPLPPMSGLLTHLRTRISASHPVSTPFCSLAFCRREMVARHFSPVFAPSRDWAGTEKMLEFSHKPDLQKCIVSFP